MKTLVLAGLLPLFMLMCSNGGSNLETKDMSVEMEPTRAAEAPAPAEADGMMEEQQLNGKEGLDAQPAQPGQTEVPQEKVVIRTASMTIEVKDVKKTRSDIGPICQALQANIVDENEFGSDYRKEINLKIRVVPQRFDSLIFLLEKMALNVDNKTINANDVTREYVDLETRLSSKRAVIERYREILKSAKTVQDILQVENSLRQVVEEVESAEGQLRYLRDQAQFSTLTLNFYQNLPALAGSSRGFLARIGEAFKDGWYGLQSFLLGLITVWPFLLILGLFIWWLVARVRRTPRAKSEG